MPLPFHRSLALSLALCAMVLRALLPVGWMPNNGPDASASPFIICSVDGHHGGNSDSDREHRHGPCAFAAAAHLSPPAFAASVPASPAEATRLAFAAADDSVVRASDYRPNAARAPPLAA
jgi:hypothetical protein